jgi:thiol-disulfide isomerase/thioredoxin
VNANGTVGDTVCLSDFLGKVVLIDFFGYSCPICQSHRADLEALHQQFSGDPDFQMIGVDVWNGPSFFVWAVYGGCNVPPCEVTYPLLIYGGINDVNDDYCMPTPDDDRGYVVVDKDGIIRSYTHLNDFEDEAVQAAIADTIAAYLNPAPPPPTQLTLTQVSSGVILRWIGSGSESEEYDLYYADDPEFTSENYLGRHDVPAAFVPGFVGQRFFRVRAVTVE